MPNRSLPPAALLALAIVAAPHASPLAAAESAPGAEAIGEKIRTLLREGHGAEPDAGAVVDGPNRAVVALHGRGDCANPAGLAQMALDHAGTGGRASPDPG